MERSPSPLNTALGWRVPERLLDLGPPAFMFFVGTAAVLVKAHRGGPDAAALWLGVLASAVALLYRRRAPLPVLGAVLAVGLASDYGPIVVLPTLITVFTVAEYCEREQVFAAGALAAAVLIAVQPVHQQPEHVRQVLATLAGVGLAVAAGLYLRARSDYVGGLQERAARLEREHELLSEQAAGEERVRIARELHDVVAHNVSLMVVQAQALAATGNGDDEQRAALGRLAGLGRDALSEMHRMLGVLRLEPATDPERAPQPGVGELGKLVAQTAESGLDVSLAVQGEPRELSSTVDLSAYRIVQEALTNVVRHAGARHVEVELRYGPNELFVTVTDDGSGPQQSPVNGSAGGHGLIGMRERVALFGGTLETGAGAGGRGYRISASLPTG